MPNAQINPVFYEWLEQTPQALAKFIELLKLWYEQSNEVPPRMPSEEGPKEFRAGEDHPLKTIGISDDELDALYQGYGEAVSREKSIAFIKGFVSGVMFIK